MQAIVIAEDPEEKDNLSYVLRKAGLAVASSSDLARVLAKWSDHPADLVLAALGPDAQPLQLVETVRQTTQTSLVLILERTPERTVCELLQGGADLVLERPVSPQMLAAQVQAVMRRAGGIPSFVLPSLDLEELHLDTSTRSVTVSGQERRLTQLEFRLLYVLMTHRGQVIPTEVLVERVWGYSGEGSRELVRGLVSRLRHKIGDSPDQPGLIETLPGVGYRFVTDEI
jgi:DNA-binding response OmpR family regulator